MGIMEIELGAIHGTNDDQKRTRKNNNSSQGNKQKYSPIFRLLGEPNPFAPYIAKQFERINNHINDLGFDNDIDRDNQKELKKYMQAYCYFLADNVLYRDAELRTKDKVAIAHKIKEYKNTFSTLLASLDPEQSEKYESLRRAYDGLNARVDAVPFFSQEKARYLGNYGAQQNVSHKGSQQNTSGQNPQKFQHAAAKKDISADSSITDKKFQAIYNRLNNIEQSKTIIKKTEEFQKFMRDDILSDRLTITQKYRKIKEFGTAFDAEFKDGPNASQLNQNKILYSLYENIVDQAKSQLQMAIEEKAKHAQTHPLTMPPPKVKQ